MTDTEKLKALSAASLELVAAIRRQLEMMGKGRLPSERVAEAITAIEALTRDI
jgi:hypothetical protein